MLHGVAADPVDPGVVTDGLVERVHHYHFVPLVHCVRSNPVGIQDANPHPHSQFRLPQLWQWHSYSS